MPNCCGELKRSVNLRIRTLPFSQTARELNGRQMRPCERTAVRLSISFPRPVVHPRKAHRKDTWIRIAKGNKKEKKKAEKGKKKVKKQTKRTKETTEDRRIDKDRSRKGVLWEDDKVKEKGG